MTANHAPPPLEAIPWRSTLGTPDPPPLPDAAGPIQLEGKRTASPRRALVVEDPLGLHEIRRKMTGAIRSLMARKEARKGVKDVDRDSSRSQLDVVLGRIREGMDRIRISLHGNRSREEILRGGWD